MEMDLLKKRKLKQKKQQLKKIVNSNLAYYEEIMPSGLSSYDMYHIYILITLKRLEWNKTNTAKYLGISLRTVRNVSTLLKSFGVKIPKYKKPKKQIDYGLDDNNNDHYNDDRSC